MSGTTEGGDFRYPYERTSLWPDQPNLQMWMDRDRALEDYISNQRTGPFITVASSDAPDDVRNDAMFECDGTADEEEIQEAMALAADAGGTVHLLGGTFTLAAAVTTNSSAAIMGSGDETVVVAPSGDYAFKTAASPGDWSISRLKISAPTGSLGGVSLGHAAAFVLFQVTVVGGGTTAGRGLNIGDLSAAVHDGMVLNCTFSSLQYGTYALTVSRWRFIGNRFTSLGIAQYFDSSTRHLIASNYYNSIQQHGIQGVSGMNDSLIAGNFIKDTSQQTNNTYSGIKVGGFRNYVHGNVFRSDSATKAAYGVTLDGSFTDNWVAMNDFFGFYATAAILDNGSSNITTWPGNRPFSGGTPTAGHSIEDEGTPLTQRSVLNFTGDSVVATDDAGGAETDVTINHLATAVHTAAQPVTVRKNSGADVGTRARLNLIEGTNVTLTVTDDGVGGEVDITVASTASGATFGETPGESFFGEAAVEGSSANSARADHKHRRTDDAALFHMQVGV